MPDRVEPGRLGEVVVEEIRREPHRGQRGLPQRGLPQRRPQEGPPQELALDRGDVRPGHQRRLEREERERGRQRRQPRPAGEGGRVERGRREPHHRVVQPPQRVPPPLALDGVVSERARGDQHQRPSIEGRPRVPRARPGRHRADHLQVREARRHVEQLVHEPAVDLPPVAAAQQRGPRGRRPRPRPAGGPLPLRLPWPGPPQGALGPRPGGLAGPGRRRAAGGGAGRVLDAAPARPRPEAASTTPENHDPSTTGPGCKYELLLVCEETFALFGRRFLYAPQSAGQWGGAPAAGMAETGRAGNRQSEVEGMNVDVR